MKTTVTFDVAEAVCLSVLVKQKLATQKAEFELRSGVVGASEWVRLLGVYRQEMEPYQVIDCELDTFLQGVSNG